MVSFDRMMGLMATSYRLSKITMSLFTAVWPQFLMQCCCLQPSPMCAELPYHALVLILAFDLAKRVWDCIHSEKSLSFRYPKSDAGLRL